MFHHLLYIDPGSGSLFYQLLLSAMLTIAVTWNKIRFYLVGLFRNFKEKRQ